MKRLGGLVIMVTAVALTAVAASVPRDQLDGADGAGYADDRGRAEGPVRDARQPGRRLEHDGLHAELRGADGQVVGSGKETFAGCHDTDRNGTCDAGEPKGTLRFSFVYWATYKPGTKTLVKGQCVHPVVGGTGAFAKAKGVIHMTDRPSKGGVLTTYTGTLRCRVSRCRR